MRRHRFVRYRSDLRRVHHVYLRHVSRYGHLRSVDVRWNYHVRRLRNLSGERDLLRNRDVRAWTYLSKRRPSDLAGLPDLRGDDNVCGRRLADVRCTADLHGLPDVLWPANLPRGDFLRSHGDLRWHGHLRLDEHLLHLTHVHGQHHVPDGDMRGSGDVFRCDNLRRRVYLRAECRLPLHADLCWLRNV